MTKQTDAAAVLVDGKLTNARLHEQMTEGVHDEDFRQQTKKKLEKAGVPKEDLDRLIK